MVSKRSRLELYLEVLRAIDRGVCRPTNIMYKCNLSWTNCKEILNFLAKKNLVSVIEEGNRKLYKLTENGKDLLENFSRVKYLLKMTKREIKPLDKALPYPEEVKTTRVFA
ncbi:MAG: winged helix-turn-helix domain-containing protein [Candidatus Bathyarchaeia archaeon]|nr:hypothetical protein [Candidatus Bathyarchaeota archaeon]